jgi:phosphopantetheine adenylyltransferase
MYFRIKFLSQMASQVTNCSVSVDSFEGLVVDYATQKNATMLIRGIRGFKYVQKKKGTISQVKPREKEKKNL